MRRRVPTLESLFVGTFVLLGLRLGTVSIRDNSMFVHLRTGIDIAHGRGIPRVDPYSFTAGGEPWVVQSWLAEASYGVLHRLGGVGLVVLQQGVLMAVLAWLLARLARAETPLRTSAAAGAVIAIGARYWSPRPLLFGLLGLAVLVTVVERKRSIWWLVPLVWLWANTHGSFALGLAWLVLRSAGDAIDARDWRAARETGRYAAVFVLGLAAAAVNPLGPRLLAFVATVADRRQALQDVVEWQSPDFDGPAGLVTLAGVLAVAGVLMVRRVGFADVVPVLAFAGAGLVAQRNLAALAVVAAPVLGRALRPSSPPRSEPERNPVHAAFAAVLIAAAAIFVVDALADDDVGTKPYPIAAVEWLEDNGHRDADARVAHQDHVGGLLILRDGRDARVFVDDRVDMYPRAVSSDYVALLRGRARSLRILDEREIDAVLWERELPLSTILGEASEWRARYRDATWAVFVRTGG